MPHVDVVRVKMVCVSSSGIRNESGKEGAINNKGKKTHHDMIDNKAKQEAVAPTFPHSTKTCFIFFIINLFENDFISWLLPCL